MNFCLVNVPDDILNYRIVGFDQFKDFRLAMVGNGHFL
jgi:hypothetical protein